MTKRFVLYTSRHGLGWSSGTEGDCRSSFDDEYEREHIEARRFVCEYAPMVEHLRANPTVQVPVALYEQMKAEFTARFPRGSCPSSLALEDLDLFAIDADDSYFVTVYDGAETVWTLKTCPWIAPVAVEGGAK